MSDTISQPCQHIILIGFMGCGKSTIGRELHQKLGIPLIDTDEAIEEKSGKSISTIFADHGEETFRNWETGYLRECQTNLTCSTIISTGGGIVLREENREILKNLGYVVWLKIDAASVYQRTKKNRSRPILQQANPKKIISDLIDIRAPYYRETANLVINITGLDRHEITTGIIESARYHFSQQA